MGRVLATNVVVDGDWYGPAYGNADQVPDDVADRLGDHVWEGAVPGTSAEPATPDEEPAPKRKSRRAAADEE